jgi:phosphatidylglycerol:prolipoprotein diacylglycerol transferase
MDYQINFPHLGIYLEHVGKEFFIGNFSIAFYGIAIVLGMLLGIWAVRLRAKETGQSPDDYLDISLITLAAAIVGARLYYVIFSWREYADDLLSIFNLRGGGLAIYGGLIGGALAILILSRVKKIPFPRVLDTCVIGVPIGQILGRWGNFFNREAFGGYTDNLFAMQLPVSAVRQNEITQEMWDNVVVQNGIRFIQVHPTFLYEGMWNCLVLLLLFLMRNRTRFEGELFLLYLAGYGTGRFFIEMLRTDQLLIPGTGIPVSMVVSASAVIISLILIAVLGRTEPAGNTRAD